MAFRGVDYFCVDSLFSQEELLVRQTARRSADERILPLIRDCYREARFPSELIPEMAELGFLGANLEGYGCAGMSNVEYGLVMQELERGTPGYTTSDIHGKWSMRASATYAGCQRNYGRIPRHASPRESGIREDIRRNGPYSRADRRGKGYGDRSVQVRPWTES
jgi:alkylation response protein AidB-like acyl-CoA dehydrogenase